MWILTINLLVLSCSIYFVFKQLTKYESFALAILILFGQIGMGTFFLNEYLGISYNKSSDYITVFNLVIFVLSLIFSFFPNFKSRINRNFNLLILVPFLLILLRNSFMPVRGWDAYSMYDGRAKVILDGQKFKDMAILSKYDGNNYMYYSSYPPMTSVIHAFIYSISLKTPMFVYALMYLSVGILIYSILDSMILSKIIKLGLLIIAIFNPIFLDQVNVAYTNLPAISFQIASIFLILKFIESNKFKYLLFPAIFLGFSNWTRSLEPIYIAIVMASVYVVLTSKRHTLYKKFTNLFIFALLAILPSLIWKNYLSVNLGNFGGTSQIPLSDILSSIPNALYLTNVIEVVFFVYKSLISIKFYFLILLIDTFYLFRLKNFVNYRIQYFLLFLILLIVSIMIAGTFYFSVTYSWWSEIPGSFLRSNLILLPLIAILTGSIINEYGKFKKS